MSRSENTKTNTPDLRMKSVVKMNRLNRRQTALQTGEKLRLR